LTSTDLFLGCVSVLFDLCYGCGLMDSLLVQDIGPEGIRMEKTSLQQALSCLKRASRV